MKSDVKIKDKVVTYPWLGANHRGAIFLVMSKDSAVCIHKGNISSYTVGEMRATGENGLERFNGSITLSN